MKPTVILHILSDLNGNINGPFFGNPEVKPALEAYGTIRKKLCCDAVVYGQRTMEEGYSDGVIQFASHSPVSELQDYGADSEIGNYIISLDPEGTLRFNSGYLEKKGRPKAQVIQVLTERVSQEYLGYLRQAGVSWINGGKDQISLEHVLEVLSSRFHIQRLMVAGGGITDWAFARKNLLDELSIVIAPAADGCRNCASVFDPIRNENIVRTYQLLEAGSPAENAAWLHCKKTV